MYMVHVSMYVYGVCVCGVYVSLCMVCVYGVWCVCESLLMVCVCGVCVVM